MKIIIKGALQELSNSQILFLICKHFRTTPENLIENISKKKFTDVLIRKYVFYFFKLKGESCNYTCNFLGYTYNGAGTTRKIWDNIEDFFKETEVFTYDHLVDLTYKIRKRAIINYTKDNYKEKYEIK